MLIVLTGKTASGKDTIKNALLSKYPNLKKVITTTSRSPRAGEKGGVDYHFLSKEDFQKGINLGNFIEYVEYGGNFYGTQKKDLENYLQKDILWRIDPSRAGKIREIIKRDLVVIYINTSTDVILQRLKNRKLSDSEIEKRMADDAKIWQENKENYDFVIENKPGKLNQAIDKVFEILENHNFINL